MTGQERPARGVRLRDLDRSRVYRLGYVGRRWEVLGAVEAPAAGAGPAPDAATEVAQREGAAYAPRHAAPDAPDGD